MDIDFDKTDERDLIVDIDEYARLADRTLAPDVRAVWKDRVLNMATGLSSEAGEINEIVKKHFFHGHPMTDEVKVHMMKELGDSAWYWAGMCLAFSFDPSEVLATNIAKLQARYPDGFETERSINRDPNDI